MRTASLALVLALAACGGSSSRPATPAGGTADGPDNPIGAQVAGSPLSEDAFKALHDRPADAAPELAGEDITLGGGKAYLSLPAGAQGPVPGVIVIHEWWGLNDNIKHWADRLATLGYAALAVDLYGGVVATDPDTAMKTMQTVKDEAALAMLAAAGDFLEQDPRVQAPTLGVIGWCFGGAWSLEAAIANPDIDAAVVYYGHVSTDAKHIAPMKAEVLGIFANLDTHITPAHVDEFEKALAAAGKQAEVHRYDADHAFANPSATERYDQADAADAWAKVQTFFARTLR